ncbi:MAG: dockerin type I domain-containing protein [bacterium]|nr:dockerin type I domain-containing protein [bacterium]
MRAKSFIFSLLVFCVGVFFGTHVVFAAGDVGVMRASDDDESKAGFVLAGREEVLAKFTFVATGEDMNVQNLVFKVNSSPDPAATNSVGDEVSVIRLYEGETQLGSAGGYVVTLSGERGGKTSVEGLDWAIPRDSSKTLTVKGVLNSISSGADSGTRLYLHLLDERFQATGSSGAADTSLRAVRGNEKVFYAAYPTISIPEQDYKLRAGTAQPVFAFRVAAGEAGDVSWKKVQLRVAMTDALMPAIDAGPAASGNVAIRDITSSPGPNLDIAQAISGESTGLTFTKNEAIRAGKAGYVTLVFADEQIVPAGTYKDYEVALPFSQVSTASEAEPSAVVFLSIQETEPTGPGANFAEAEGFIENDSPSFIWSDRSSKPHSELSEDFANGALVPGLPSESLVVRASSRGDSPSLDLQLAAAPSSATYARGSEGVPFVGFSFRALGGDVRVESVQVRGAVYEGSLDAGEVQSLALYDGSTKVSSELSWSPLASMVFDNLSVRVSEGETKVLTLRGNISASANAGDVYAFSIPAAESRYVKAREILGVSANISGTTANASGTVRVTVAGGGDVSALREADDEESAAGIVIAGREEVLAKFRFTAAFEDMTVWKMRLAVTPASRGAGPAPGAAGEVPRVKLYDGDAQIGSSPGYPVVASGDNAGVAFVENLNWKIPRDGTKTLTVKGVLNFIQNGAESGSAIRAHLLPAGFEARGGSSEDTDIQTASGNEKVVYATEPIFTIPEQEYRVRAGTQPIFMFRVAVHPSGALSWKKIQFDITPSLATVAALQAEPGAQGNVTIRPISLSGYPNLQIARAIGEAIPSGSTGRVTLILASEEMIAAGESKTYEVSLPFAEVGDSPSVSIRLALQETELISSPASFSGVEKTVNDIPSFIWSDRSVSRHSETTSDWTNGRYVSGLPSSFVLIGDTREEVSSSFQGDINGDGCVNIIDLTTIAKRFGEQVQAGSKEDVNGDGVVNIIDLVTAARRFGDCAVVGASDRVLFVPVRVVQRDIPRVSRFASILKSVLWVIGE